MNNFSGPNIKLQKISCPLCSSIKATIIASVKDFEYNTVSNLFEYHQCIHCGLIYLNPRPTAKDIPLIYPIDYEQYSKDMSELSMKKFVQDLRAKLIISPRMKNVIMYSKKNSILRVLDIGCGNGHALLAIKKFVKGCELHGVDLGDSQKRILEKQGIVFHQGTFKSVKLPHAYFDIIMFIHSIEHLINPVSVISKVSSLLRPGGLVYLETHIADCLEQKIFGPYWIGFDAPRHMTVFNTSTLRNLLVKSGYNIVIYDDHILSVGDIIYSLRRYLSDKFRSRVLRLLISDRNIFLLFGSLIFNIIRRNFVNSSVVRVIAQKKDDQT